MRVFAREKMPSVSKPAKESFVNVEVTLLDANDNNPTFVPSNLYEFSLSNRAKVGHVVGKVEAVDPDLGRNGMVLYEMKGNKTTGGYMVHPQTGVITTGVSPLPVGRAALFIEAADQPANPSERRFSLAVISVEVVPSDKVRMLPDFVGAPYEFWVGDDASVGTSIGQVRINEAIDKKRALFDLLHSYHEGVPFAVEERSGVITVVDEISRYRNNEYDFEAVVTDEMSTTLVTNVTVHVVDGSLSSGGSPSLLKFRVKENLSGAIVGKIVTTPFKGLRPFKYTIQGDSGSVFGVSQDGSLYTQRALDRETRDNYLVNVVGEGGRGRKHYQAQVTVEDVNDNPPRLDRSWYEGSVPEECPACLVRGVHLHAKDPDLPPHDSFTLALRGDSAHRFTLTPHGRLKTVQPLDRETARTHTLIVVATDSGNLSSQARVTVHVEDVNDNAPSITQLYLNQLDQYVLNVTAGNYTDLQVVVANKTLSERGSGFPRISVAETLPPGTQLLRVVASDRDAGHNATVAYSLTESSTTVSQAPAPTLSHFAVHPVTGHVSVTASLPPASDFLLRITATDTGGLNDTRSVVLSISDINDHAPVFDKPSYEFSLAEGSYRQFIVGRVSARDADLGLNGHVTYSLKRDDPSLPFTITPDGHVVADGKLDREDKDNYKFKVSARDGGLPEIRLRSTVQVMVHIVDTNDNPPLFYGYGHVVQITKEEMEELTSAPAHFVGSVALPVYYATVAENSVPGTAVARLYANDSDSSDSGSAVVLYDIVRKENHRQHFSVDKEGLVTVTYPLDYETQRVHNVTVIASDLGSPSLTSTALLTVTVTDIHEPTSSSSDSSPARPLLDNNYFELEVEENCEVPVELVQVKVSRPGEQYRFTLRGDQSSFSVHPTNGTLYLITSPDRETHHSLETTVVVSPSKRAKTGATLLYPLPGQHLEENEVRVVVRVRDMNDNVPTFLNTNGKRPLVVAIPTSASYGYPVIRLQARDDDEGENGQVRYHLITKSLHEAGKFAIDPETGQVRATASFHAHANQLYSLDIRAVDRLGASDGLYSTANLLVYIIEDKKKLILELGALPSQVEMEAGNITHILSNLTGLEVKVRKFEPQLASDLTDMYLYAVDPEENSIVDMETLNELLASREDEVRRALPLQVHAIRLPHPDPTPSRTPTITSPLSVSSLELATMGLGCIVFLGAITSAFCVICLHKRRKKSDSLSLGGGGTLFRGKLARPDDQPRSLFFPNAFHEDSTSCNGRTWRGGAGRAECPRHGTRPIMASMASVHSSGRDSGIVEPHHCCPCPHSSSDTSQGSYEDSLKSLQRGGHDSMEATEHRSRQQTLRSQRVGGFPPPPPPTLSTQRLLIC